MTEAESKGEPKDRKDERRKIPSEIHKELIDVFICSASRGKEE